MPIPRQVHTANARTRARYRVVPFTAWGIDIIGPFKEDMAREHKYVLVTPNYFSKWAEAIKVHDFTTPSVSDFIGIHIIYRINALEAIKGL